MSSNDSELVEVKAELHTTQEALQDQYQQIAELQTDVIRLTNVLHEIAADSECAETVRQAVDAMLTTDAGISKLRMTPLQ